LSGAIANEYGSPAKGKHRKEDKVKVYSDGDLIYPASWWRDVADQMGKPIVVELQKRAKKAKYLFCTSHRFFVLTANTCGMKCSAYSPRNGKSGCCRWATRGFTGTGEFYEINEKGKIRRAK